jgi:salicylate hydroxylase
MAALDNANVLDGHPGSIQLEVLIVGGGIAGLAAAIAMSRAGHNVTVLEKSSFKREAGFIITLGSNATAILDTFGFDFSKSRAVDCASVSNLDLELKSWMVAWKLTVLAVHNIRCDYA